ncbi:MAG: hypothetical protein WCD76_11100 [Pyrinomonadaceae bacterium]
MRTVLTSGGTGTPSTRRGIATKDNYDDMPVRRDESSAWEV